MTNLDSIVKSRDITLPSKVKAMVFPVVMYGCELWASLIAQLVKKNPPAMQKTLVQFLGWELDYKEGWALKN